MFRMLFRLPHSKIILWPISISASQMDNSLQHSTLAESFEFLILLFNSQILVRIIYHYTDCLISYYIITLYYFRHWCCILNKYISFYRTFVYNSQLWQLCHWNFDKRQSFGDLPCSNKLALDNCTRRSVYFMIKAKLHALSIYFMLLILFVTWF